MTKTDFSLAMVGRLLRRRWPVFTALALVGAVLGFGSSFVLAPGYVSECKVLLRGDRDEKQLPSEANIATSRVVLDGSATALGWNVTGADLQGRLGASVDGNVLTITGAAETPQRAQQLVKEATNQYIVFSEKIINDDKTASADELKNQRDAAQKLVDDANERLADLRASPDVTATGPAGDQARAQLNEAQDAVTEAVKQVQQIDTAAQDGDVKAAVGRSSLRIIEPAVLPGGLAAPTVYQLIAGGAAALVILGVLGHLFSLRSNKVPQPHAAAAALGASVIGEVELADPAPPTGLLRKLRYDDQQWARPSGLVTEDERGRASRYERILRRANADGSPMNLLILVPDDDLAAAVLVGELAVAACRTGRVSVVTVDAMIRERVGRCVAAHGVGAEVTIGAEEPEGCEVIRAVAFSPVRPNLPDVPAT